MSRMWWCDETNMRCKKRCLTGHCALARLREIDEQIAANRTKSPTDSLAQSVPDTGMFAGCPLPWAIEGDDRGNKRQIVDAEGHLVDHIFWGATVVADEQLTAFIVDCVNKRMKGLL